MSAIARSLLSIASTLLSLFSKMWEAKHDPEMIARAASRLDQELKDKENELDKNLQNPNISEADHNKFLDSLRLSQS